MNSINEEISKDDTFNIVDVLLIDHSYLRECIAILTDDTGDKKQKLFYARTFLDTLKNHSLAKEKTVYESLVDMEEFRKHILQSVIENDLIKLKYESLLPEMLALKTLNPLIEEEIKFLADFVKFHLGEEEIHLYPKMRAELDHSILNEIGFQFMILRKFSPQDLSGKGELQKEIYSPNFKIQRPSRYIYQWSGKFVEKVNRYISSIVGQSYIKN